MASSWAAVSWSPKFAGMVPATDSYPAAVSAFGSRIDRRM